MNIKIESIGVIHSPFTTIENMPIQSVGAQDAEGTVVLEERYAEGLKDIEGFNYIYLIYYFHKASRGALHVTPFMDTEKRGVFATRSPLRPSHIGFSIVELIGVKENVLRIRGCDILDDTPLLDIKPYIPRFDIRNDAKTGWMKAMDKDIKGMRSDDRFV
ncbi:tRNA (N6-threonylcarbamoyladenosine(37)-N6)-methyltransferase TrmO [Desulfosarcina sp.]|nr:tRNA (N6-threonylcarbamoyladenosine(37)-N6)-methyltransferase TrmO [Desulfosarcina sp.]